MGSSAIFPILKTEVKGGIVALSVKFVVRASFSRLNIGTLNYRGNYNRISKFRKLIIENKAFGQQCNLSHPETEVRGGINCKHYFF